MQKLTLIGTPTSHFVRKIRILFHELKIDFDFQLVGDLLEGDAAPYGQNPLMQVPTLVDRDLWIIESDHIARHVVTTRASHDPLCVLTPTTADLNQLAVLNGIMAHEATFILASRSGLIDVLTHAYFQKLVKAITSGLSWLDREVDVERDSFNYIDVATICMWEHHTHFGLVPGLQTFPHIAKRVARFAGRNSVVRTTPKASLIAKKRLRQ